MGLSCNDIKRRGGFSDNRVVFGLRQRDDIGDRIGSGDAGRVGRDGYCQLCGFRRRHGSRKFSHGITIGLGGITAIKSPKSSATTKSARCITL